ncbi:MAG: methyltransferase domain-containing protein [Alphaproteobacteria bacterium]|nr:methyltransferase domain-containing protein [Alphaproteobacteria bacterium]
MSVAHAFTATNGEAYEIHMGRWSKRLAEVFLDFAGVAEGEQVLDLGCGTGSLTFALAQRVEKQTIVGVDLSEAYVEHARSLTDNPQIQFRVGDATAIPVPDDSVDRVLSLLLLSFVEDTQGALTEMKRIARPGSTIAAAIWDTMGGHVTNRIFWDAAAVFDPHANELRKTNYTRPMTQPGELAGAWQQAGLENVEEGMLAVRMNFESFDDFWLPNLGKQGPIADYVDSLEPEAFDKLRGHLREAYLGGYDDGPRSFAGVAWCVKGTMPKA